MGDGDSNPTVGHDGTEVVSRIPTGESVSHSTNGHAGDHTALHNPALAIPADQLPFDKGLSQWVNDRIRDGYLWAFLGAVAAAAVIVYLIRTAQEDALAATADA